MLADLDAEVHVRTVLVLDLGYLLTTHRGEQEVEEEHAEDTSDGEATTGEAWHRDLSRRITFEMTIVVARRFPQVLGGQRATIQAWTRSTTTRR